MDVAELEAFRARTERELLEKLMRELVARQREEIRAAVAEGLEQGVKRLIDPENSEQLAKATDVFWASAFSVARKNATSAAGGWLLGGLSRAGRAAMWALVLAVALWMTLGLNGIIGVMKAIATARSSS